MTAPNVAPAPAQAPTQTAIIDQSAPATIPLGNPARSFNDSIRAIANKTGVAPEAVVETPTVTFVRDPAKAAEDAPGSHDLPPGSVPPVVAAPVAESVEPAGELSVDDGEITLTAQRNGDGTFKTKLDPTEKVDLVIKSEIDPATGKPKVYSKSLPELARLAKDGITLQRTVQTVKKEMDAIKPEVEYYRGELPKWQADSASKDEQIANLRALNVELLTADDELVIQRREQYKAEMSPEKQLARIKAEQESERQTASQRAKAEQHAKIAKSFMGSRIAPALKAAEESGVSKFAVIGLVTDLTSDLMVNGAIPPANWPEMERRINAPDGPFQQQVKAEAARRTTESDTVKAAREAAEAAQRRAQQVVNTDGRLMAPIGRAGADGAPQLPPAKNVDEVKHRLINRPLPQSMTGSG